MYIVRIILCGGNLLLSARLTAPGHALQRLVMPVDLRAILGLIEVP